MRRVSFYSGVLVFSLSVQAWAQAGAANNRAAAEALFNEGRSLMASGKFNEACPKFEASQQLDPGLGTLLNLAECYEKTGRTASAWAEYREAIPLARAAGSKARQELASERAAALEARLSTLTIRAMAGHDDSVALDIRRDGVPVQPAELGSAIPVDPGPHTIEAFAPGKKKWSATVNVGNDGAKVAVEVPALDPVDSAASSAPPPPVEKGPPRDEPSSSGSSQRTAAIVVGSAGVIGLGLGAFFGLSASSSWSEAKSSCSEYPFGCDAKALDERSSARSKATVSTVAFIAGGLALGVGGVLWFTAPSKKESNVALGIGPGSAFVRGSFQ